MVNHSESIKSLQDTTSQLQTHAEDQKRWNTSTEKMLQEMAHQLQTISAQLRGSATTSGSSEAASACTVNHRKAKLRAESEDLFPFAPKLVKVELPVFTG
ncbi:hypothetical protein HRI_001384800 [Hibiscus trionum]|uniref:Uncharacterized protein n=1 Tax=Hibiscus trionum TaxID=183268 RepID=A0A9W7HJS6_HIBTR|nr:hypothetical protein HRI_001384800 [Hibiscus trionum]